MGDRSTLQAVALIFGALYLVAGIVGIFNHVILGIFQVNLLQTMVHVVIGIAGLAAASSLANARTFCRVAGVILLLLGLIGFGVANPFGLMYISGADIALHLGTGAVLAYFGFAAPVSTRSA